MKLKTEEVYDFLREKLETYEFRPGQLLSEKEIVSSYRCSRTPVRQALSKMEKEGLIEVIPRKGAFVRFLSVKDVAEIFQLRKALEGLAAFLSVNNLNSEELLKFETFYTNYLSKNSSEEPQVLLHLGMKFHDFIVDSTGNNRLKEILANLRVQLKICRMFFLNQRSDIHPPRSIQSIEEHLGIIQALKEGNGFLAEERMRAHILNAEKYTLTLR